MTNPTKKPITITLTLLEDPSDFVKKDGAKNAYAHAKLDNRATINGVPVKVFIGAGGVASFQLVEAAPVKTVTPEKPKVAPKTFTTKPAEETPPAWFTAWLATQGK